MGEEKMSSGNTSEQHPHPGQSAHYAIKMQQLMANKTRTNS